MLASLPLLACATTDTVKAARGRHWGVAHTYDGSCEDHWPGVGNAARNLGLKPVEAKPPEELILERPLSTSSWGENVAIWLTPAGDECRIEVYSRRTDPLDVVAEDFESRFFRSYQP
jgi:hypothetical protein